LQNKAAVCVVWCGVVRQGTENRPPRAECIGASDEKSTRVDWTASKMALASTSTWTSQGDETANERTISVSEYYRVSLAWCGGPGVVRQLLLSKMAPPSSITVPMLRGNAKEPP